MADRRLTPANARVAAAHLEGLPASVQAVTGQPRQVSRPVVDLCQSPEGKRDRQVLFGERLNLYEDRGDWAFVQMEKDGYVGYLPSAALAPLSTPTHWVCAPATHVYQEADFKSPDLCSLSFGSRLSVTGTKDRFAVTESGYVPLSHLHSSGQLLTDPVSVAELFLGTPYLWGGNSRAGIDCSGLVQAALLACGQRCPGDSDLQEKLLGKALPAGSPYQRGDVLFWKGHVGLVHGPDSLIHANAFHMAVVIEPLQSALERILAQGDGPVTSHRRVKLTAGD